MIVIILKFFPHPQRALFLKCSLQSISEIKFCFIMPTFKGLMPNTFLTPTFWLLNWFLSFILCYYWVVQAHLQRFSVLEVFWCHGIIKNSHLCCLYSAIVSFPSGKWVGWSRAADSSLYRRQKAFTDWDEVLCLPLLQQVQQHWPLFKATSEPNPVSYPLCYQHQ